MKAIRSIIITVIFILMGGSTVWAQEVTQKLCEAEKKLVSELEFQLIRDADLDLNAFSSNLSEVLADFSKRYRSTPSFEEYKRLLIQNNGDKPMNYFGAYEHMRGFGSKLDKDQLKEKKGTLNILLRYSNSALHKDLHAYIICLDKEMMATIQALPPQTNYKFRRDDILNYLRKLRNQGQSEQISNQTGKAKAG